MDTGSGSGEARAVPAISNLIDITNGASQESTLPGPPSWPAYPSEQGPGVGRPVPVVDQLRQRVQAEQPGRPVHRGGDLGRLEEPAQFDGWPLVGETGQVLLHGRLQGLAAEVPDHGAQLVVGVEAQAV